MEGGRAAGKINSVADTGVLAGRGERMGRVSIIAMMIG